ncbi:MAG: hypothetical protein R3E39_12445 [Anaerolineae bacterium]
MLSAHLRLRYNDVKVFLERRRVCSTKNNGNFSLIVDIYWLKVVLFSAEEVAFYREHYMAVRAAGAIRETFPVLT